jgi:hypothetical protein
MIDTEAVRATLAEGKTYSQPLETVIQEVKTGKEVARVKTIWQLKPWEQVKTRS